MHPLEKTYLIIKITLLSAIGIVFFVLVVSNWDSIVELNVPGVGSIKMEARQDADAIKEIRKRVERDSTRIEEVAKKAEHAQKIIESVQRENDVVKKQIEDITTLQSQAQNTINSLNQTLHFARTFISAYADDRKAYEQLIKWSQEKSYPFQKEAEKAFLSILEKHNQPFQSSGFTIPWSKEIDPSKLTLNDICQTYAKVPDYLKPALLEFVWQNKKITKYNKMKFMIDAMGKENSLRAVEYAGRYFKQGSGLKVNPLATEFMTKWWENNKERMIQQ